MPTTTDLTTSFVGEFAGQYLQETLLTSNSLTNGMVTLKTNIYGAEIVKRIALSGNLFQDASCDFSADGTVTIDERTIAPKRMKINKQLCKKDFDFDWETRSQGPSATEKLAPRVQREMIAAVLGNAAAANEIMLWQGVDGAGAYDGFETLFAADTVVQANTTTGTENTTATNVLDLIGTLLDSVPVAVREMPGFKIGVAPNVYYALRRAYGGFGADGLGANGINGEGAAKSWDDTVLPFEGVQIVKCKGMKANSMVATYSENLMFGTALMSDWNSVKLIDQENVDGSENVNFISKFSAAVQYGWGGDIYYYEYTA